VQGMIVQIKEAMTFGQGMMVTNKGRKDICVGNDGN